ncbi:hypothetical protein ICN48_11740 [Polynucleobacter sp. JS-Safj-400b-B2]|nr:hypothetical protein [Polynucleobacter sp. JS-Safj-400b-B2]
MARCWHCHHDCSVNDQILQFANLA